MKFLAGAILLATLSSTAAHADEPASTTCFAGSRKVTVMGASREEKAVIQRALDPAKGTLVETIWSPGKEKKLEAAIDAKAGTFTWKAEDGKTGTGTLVGPAWHWTAQALTYTKGDFKMVIESSRVDKTITTKATITNGTRAIGSEAGTFTVVDCAKLDAARAALK